MPSSLAVVIVSYNVRELLRACLRATFASLARSPELATTVWVVDNASADGSAAMTAAEFPQAKLIASDVNLGFAGGNNLALHRLGFGGAEVGVDMVLLLNPDAEPLDDAIGQMARFLVEHEQIGGVGAQLLYPDGQFQHGAFRFPGLWQLWFDLFPPRPRRLLDSRLNGRYDRGLYAAGRPFPIDFALGAALMIRREAIEAAGLLDEGYFMYAEEVDWCWRIQRAGWPFYSVPAAHVIHHGGASTRQFRAESFLNLWRSRRRLYARFYGPVRRRLAVQIVRLGMRAEIGRVRGAAGRGEISAAELHDRVAAARQVASLFKNIRDE
ncbi:MAG: glycosyltransferase family 2 protein [Chloroflexi bacterium]|nr:glycosyltransferase family 2 protein [Chloroflexota bacterium]